MRTKISQKFDILLIAITLLLIFVISINNIGKTNSWLTDFDQIGFEINVSEINLEIKQGEREIINEGNIYLGTKYIEADTEYLTSTNSVTVKNNETGTGYYLRCQAFAVVDGVTYNINSCITTDLYKRSDNWMYCVDNDNNNVAMTTGQSLTVIKKLVFPESFVNSVQGKYIKLHLFIEGSATGVFTTA